MIVFVNGTGVKFGRVTDKSVVESHVSEWSIDSLTMKNIFTVFF